MADDRCEHCGCLYGVVRMNDVPTQVCGCVHTLATLRTRVRPHVVVASQADDERTRP